MTFELVDRFGKFWQFEIDEFQFFVEDLAALVFQFDDMQKGLVGFVVVKNEVQDSDGIDGTQFKVPFAFEGLFLDGKGCIVDAAVFEKILFCFLDFDDEAIAILGLTVEVENGFPVKGRTAELFRIFER